MATLLTEKVLGTIIRHFESKAAHIKSIILRVLPSLVRPSRTIPILMFPLD